MTKGHTYVQQTDFWTGESDTQRPGAEGTELKNGSLVNIVLAPGRRGSGEGAYCVRFGGSFGRSARLGMDKDLSYDMALEAQGLIRSIVLRTTLNRDLSVGETFTIEGRRWIVSRMDRCNAEDIDWRLVAHELVEDDPSPALA
jgi:hypothetical protein